MAKNSVRDFDATAANNTDIESVNIAEGCAPSGINNAIRELMADMKDVSAGTIALESPQADSMTVTGDLTVDTDTLFVDASADSVGIGTTSPETNLHIENSSAPTLRLENTDTTITEAQSIGLIEFASNDSSTGGAGISGSIKNVSANATGNSYATVFSVGNASGGSLVLNEIARISNDGVGIGTSTVSEVLHLHRASGSCAMKITDSTTGTGTGDGFEIGKDSNQGGFVWNYENSVVYFGTNNTERARIDSSGNLLVGTTDSTLWNNSSATGAGVKLGANQRIEVHADGADCMRLNRTSSDGGLVFFNTDGSSKGSISISGSITSYNAFSGSHWGRLADNSKPTILRGTIIESIGTMIDWYEVEFDVDIDGETVTKRRNITKPANVEDGDTFDYVVSDDDATSSVPAGTYSGTLRLEEDEKHPHVKISDTSESKVVYGVFLAWDNDDATVNDMYVTAVGTSVVRILSTETVAIGDLLDSNGDGTAKVQSDDIIRARTIGKVISTVKQETYSDGSYTVPCAIYCG